MLELPGLDLRSLKDPSLEVRAKLDKWSHVVSLWSTGRASEALEIYLKEILPAVALSEAERFRREEAAGVLTPPDILLTCVGERFYPIVIFLVTSASYAKGHKPTAYLVHSNETKEEAKQAAKLASQLTELEVKYVEVDPASVTDVASKLSKLPISENNTVYVDLTGGTKAMVVGLLSSAWAFRDTKGARVYFFYTTSIPEPKLSDKRAPHKPFTEKVRLQGSPQQLLSQLYLARVRELIAQGEVEAALPLLKELIAYSIESSERALYTHLHNVYEVINLLKDLKIRKYVKHAKELQLPELDIAKKLTAQGIIVEHIKALKLLAEELELVKKAQSDHSLLLKDPQAPRALAILAATILWIAEYMRQPWASAQLYYRTIELSLQALLLKHGLWTGALSEEKMKQLGIPEDTIRDAEKWGWKVGLKIALKIAKHLNPKLPLSPSEVDSYTQERNTSIAAHGLNQPDRKSRGYEKLVQKAKEITEYTLAELKALERAKQITEALTALTTRSS